MFNPASSPVCRTNAMSDPARNPALDQDRISQAFARTGGVHIPGFLTEESATRVHRCLEQETDFSIITRNGPGYVRLRPGATLTPQQQTELMGNAYS
jgi:hypothetical protein